MCSTTAAVPSSVRPAKRWGLATRSATTTTTPRRATSTRRSKSRVPNTSPSLTATTSPRVPSCRSAWAGSSRTPTWSCCSRRKELLEVGGIAVETVTEDAHTAHKLSRLGYNTAYLEVPQAAGLATEILSGHVGQRIRWARGMAQIARTDNPLFGKGLKFGQRLCYLNAMLHFFYGLPRLVFLTAPLAYLFFGAHVFQATALMITAYALPHLAHASVTNSRIQGRFRHSFWNEVYESVLAWYIMRPVIVAFINPKLGKFNVTAKGGVIEKAYFDWTIARPYV